MESHDTPGAPPLRTAAAEQLRALLELKAQLQRLHAELEYVRLMLKVGARHF
jgi:hypothetical protein